MNIQVLANVIFDGVNEFFAKNKVNVRASRVRVTEPKLTVDILSSGSMYVGIMDGVTDIHSIRFAD